MTSSWEQHILVSDFELIKYNLYLTISFICAWINGWVNNRKAGDFRRHRGHYDVIVMLSPQHCCIQYYAILGRVNHCSIMKLRGILFVYVEVCLLFTGIILWICPVNERWCYVVTPPLIGWAHTKNDLCWVPSYYQNECWVVINWTHGNKSYFAQPSINWYRIYLHQSHMFLLKYSIKLQWLKTDDRASQSSISMVT